MRNEKLLRVLAVCGILGVLSLLVILAKYFPIVLPLLLIAWCVVLFFQNTKTLIIKSPFAIPVMFMIVFNFIVIKNVESSIGENFIPDFRIEKGYVENDNGNEVMSEWAVYPPPLTPEKVDTIRLCWMGFIGLVFYLTLRNPNWRREEQ